MEAIKHNLTIKTTADKIFHALTNEEGLKGWWAKDTTAKPEVGFVNVFTFGSKYRNEMKVTKIVPNKKVEWQCINSVEEWVNTTLSFDLEEKDGKTILRFRHSSWAAATDFFAHCSYDWAIFMRSLKLLCETGTGTPA
jgi:uncharacterized protein YndB with AHSA1/START domain